MAYYLLFQTIILGSCLAILNHANENDCLDESRNYLHYTEPMIQENLLVYNSFLGGSYTCSSISNFAHFNELILDCNQKYNITKCVAIWPKNPLIIDETFLLNKHRYLKLSELNSAPAHIKVNEDQNQEFKNVVIL